MSIIAADYDHTFTVALVGESDFDPETGSQKQGYQDVTTDLRGMLNPYSNSQDTERYVAEEQESVVHYKLYCDEDSAIVNQFHVVPRGTRITMNESPGTVSYVVNSINTGDHIVSVTEEFQVGEKLR